MNEDIRKQRLNALIDNSFFHLNEDDIENILEDFDDRVVAMIEFTDVYLTSANAIDFDHSHTDYPLISLPPEFSSLIQPQDVFMVQMGMKRDQWHIVWMSPLYESVSFDEDFEENYDDDEIKTQSTLLLESSLRLLKH